MFTEYIFLISTFDFVPWKSPLPFVLGMDYYFQNNMAAAWQHNESLSSTNGYMFDNNILCDVTLLAGADRQEVKCHRNILASRSPVFYTMFCGSLQEKGLVEIPDVEASVLKVVVRYTVKRHF